MMIALTMSTNEMVTIKVMEEAIATGTATLLASTGSWLHVAGIKQTDTICLSQQYRKVK